LPTHLRSIIRFPDKEQPVRRIRLVSCFALVVCAVAVLAHAQVATYSLPLTIIENEGTACYQYSKPFPVKWVFDTPQGTGLFNGNTDQTILLKQIDEDHIVVDRTVTAGGAAGMTARYTGTIYGHAINGTVEYRDPGKTTVRRGAWCGILTVKPEAAASTALQVLMSPPSGQVAGIHSHPLKNVLTLEDFPRPTSPAWHKFEVAESSLDLNGSWEMQYGVPDSYGSWHLKIFIFQMRNHAMGFVEKSTPLPEPGEEFMYIAVPAGPGIEFTGWAKDLNTKNFVQMQKSQFKILDSDHFQVTNARGVLNFVRKTRIPTSIEDVACDTKAPISIDGAEAYYRGQMYIQLGDNASAACWFYLGAERGNPGAQMSYGAFLYKGSGVPQDLYQSFYWTQLAAMQDDRNAGLNLWVMLKNGEGTPASAARAQYWAERSITKDPDYQHDYEWGYHPIPLWARATSDFCDSSNPNKVTAEDAYVQGFVAYMARALDRSTCWFQISADEGNVKANVYLGILSTFYMKGKNDPKRGFAYMKKAADAEDVFGIVYLSEYYDRGIGTERNDSQSVLLRDKAFKSNNGIDAYQIARGIIQSASTDAAVSANQGEAESEAYAQKEECMRRHGGASRDSQGNAVCAVDSDFSAYAGTAHHSFDEPEEILPEIIAYHTNSLRNPFASMR
jgi:hypothetical protein